MSIIPTANQRLTTYYQVENYSFRQTCLSGKLQYKYNCDILIQYQSTDSITSLGNVQGITFKTKYGGKQNDKTLVPPVHLEAPSMFSFPYTTLLIFHRVTDMLCSIQTVETKWKHVNAVIHVQVTFKPRLAALYRHDHWRFKQKSCTSFWVNYN